MQPLNEYAPRTPEAIEELKKKVKSKKKKDKIQEESDAWKNLWLQKSNYLSELPPGTVATYLEIYSDKRVQQALSKLDAYYRPRINFSVALQIKLNNLKPIGV